MITGFLKTIESRLPFLGYASYRHPDREFGKHLVFFNFNRTWIGVLSLMAASCLFLSLRLSLYRQGHTLIGYDALILFNGIIFLASIMYIVLMIKHRPASPGDITRIHSFLVYSAAFIFIFFISMAAGYEYLGGGELTRFFFGILCLCIILVFNWYALLFYFTASILTLVLTVYWVSGGMVALGFQHMHLPILLLVFWFVSRAYYISTVKDYQIRKTLVQTNANLEKENAGRLKALDDLKKSESYLKTLFEKAPDAYLLYDAGRSVFTQINACAEELFDYLNEEVTGKGFRDIVILSDGDFLMIEAIINETLEQGFAGPYEFSLTLRNGRYVVVEIRCSLTSQGGRTMLLATARDVTWRKNAEEKLLKTNIDLEERVRERSRCLDEANTRLKKEISNHKHTETVLRKTEEQSRMLIERMNDGFVVFDMDMKVTYANERLCAMLGNPASGILGKSFYDFVQDDCVGELKEHISTGPSPSHSTAVETILKKEDGGKLHAYVSPQTIYNEEGQVDGRFSVIADISALKNAEKRIHSLSQELIKVQENERQRISRDLHDNVAQELASLKILCETLFDGHREVPADVKGKIGSFSAILQHTIMSVRDMAYDLRPPGLDQLGLVSTIGNYIDDYTERNHMEVDYFSAGVSRYTFAPDSEINLYRIIQEALHNIVKHAHADRVVIRLTASFPKIILRIEDNGQGFDLDARMSDASTEKRMGLRSMEERARLLSGAIYIRSQKDKGTKIAVEIPIKGNVIDIEEQGDVLYEA